MKLYELGKIYRNSGGRVWQVVKITSTRMHYIWLPSEQDDKGSFKSIKTFPFYYDDDHIEILENYQYDGLPCEDCLAFCKQQCQLAIGWWENAPG